MGKELEPGAGLAKSQIEFARLLYELMELVLQGQLHVLVSRLNAYAAAHVDEISEQVVVNFGRSAEVFLSSAYAERCILVQAVVNELLQRVVLDEHDAILNPMSTGARQYVQRFLLATYNHGQACPNGCHHIVRQAEALLNFVELPTNGSVSFGPVTDSIRGHTMFN